ncbi:MAG: RelA/SpoT domain-containing protein, partial [Methylocella sp.]
MTKYTNPLIDEYKSKFKAYEELTTSLHQTIKALMQEERDKKHSIVAIEARTKEVESVEEKVTRKGDKYTSLDQITDLSGIRIIACLKEEVDRICDSIKKNFHIDYENSVDKGGQLNPDQFGYRSIHYVVAYKTDWLKLPLYKRFDGKKAEVQVRTILEHAWASIDWRLRYKPEFEDLPESMKRHLYRISALLETADMDFTSLNNLTLDLSRRYEENIKKGNLEIEVNQDSLEQFLDIFLAKSDTVSELKSIAKKAKFHISPPHPRTRNPMLNLSIALHVAGIAHISALKETLKAARAGAPAFLGKLYKIWDKNTKERQNRPEMLGIDLGSLIRLLVIE